MTLALSILMLAAAPGGATPNEQSVDEDHVKAGFLFNFARFVEWPATSSSGPLVIGAISDDAFMAALERVLRDRSIEGRPLVAKRVRDGEDPSACQVLFISSSWRGRSADVLQRAAKGPILTVGESVQFLREGGVVRFYSEGNRIRFQISRENATVAGLKISSHLLNLAAR